MITTNRAISSIEIRDQEAHDPIGDKDYEDEPILVPTLAVEDSDERYDSERTPYGDDEGSSYIPMKEVARHDLAHDAWVVIDGKVYE